MPDRSILFPPPLQKGSRIGVTAPSSGVAPKFYRRLDLAIQHLQSSGAQVVEGSCLRGESHHHVSAPAKKRVRDLVALWEEPGIGAIIPPWGGELLIEILPELDFERFRRNPKWILGYSDLSTLLFPITLLSRVATAHGTNLMDWMPTQTDPLTKNAHAALWAAKGSSFTQVSSVMHQTQWGDFQAQFDVPFQLTEPTIVQSLHGENTQFEGRLLGGCLDTLMNLVGTPYGDVPSFVSEHSERGVILYFENCELAPSAVARALWNMRMADWFRGVRGIVFGRSSGKDRDPENAHAISYREALRSVLNSLGIPVILDADIGHQPPQMTLVNGSFAEVILAHGQLSVRQTLA
jgi:muramoyltetrapeptide carboxypeptidase LdcA involved in peptidoglycan recycling